MANIKTFNTPSLGGREGGGDNILSGGRKTMIVHTESRWLALTRVINRRRSIYFLMIGERAPILFWSDDIEALCWPVYM
jgi:hypothetical protein